MRKLLLFCFLWWAAGAAGAVELDPALGRVTVGKAERLVDLKGGLSLNDVDLLDFSQAPPPSPNGAEGPPRLWLKIDLFNPTPSPQTWFLRFEDPVDRPVDFFLLGPLGVYHEQNSQGLIPFAPDSAQPLRSHPAFALTLQPNQHRLGLLRMVLEPAYLKENPRLSLLTPKALAEEQAGARLLEGGYLAGCLGLLALAGLGWLFGRQRGYLYLGLSTALLGLAQVFSTGRGLEFLLAPYLRLYPQLWGLFLMGLGALSYSLFLVRGLKLGWGHGGSLKLAAGLQGSVCLLGPLYGFLIAPDLPLPGLLAALSAALWAWALIGEPPLRIHLFSGLLLALSLLSGSWAWAAWALPLGLSWSLGWFALARSRQADQIFFDKIAKLAGENRLRDEYINKLEQKATERTSELLAAKARAEETRREESQLLESLCRQVAGRLSPEQQDLENLVQDLLDYARLIEGPPEGEPVNARAELEALTNLLAPQARAAELALSHECPPDLPALLQLCRPYFWLIGLRLFRAGSELGQGGALRLSLSQPGPGELRLSAWIAGSQAQELAQSFDWRNAPCDLGLGVLQGLVESLGGEIGTEAAHGGQWLHAQIPVLSPVAEARKPSHPGKKAQVAAASDLKTQALTLALGALGVEAEPIRTPDQVGGADWLVLGELARWSGGEAWSEAAQTQGMPLVDLSLSKPLAALDLGHLSLALDQPPRASSETPPETEPGSLADRFPLKVVIAEDDLTTRYYLEKMFQAQGYHPWAVSNGKKLMELLRREAIDLVLMDVRMPVMDGLEAARRINLLFPTERRPLVVAHTANAVEQEKELYLSVGLDDFVVKPLLPHALGPMVLRWTEQLKKLRKNNH